MVMGFLQDIRKQCQNYIIKNNIVRKILFFLFYILSLTGMAQNFTISGYVMDNNTGEYLIGASVYDTLSHTGTITNKYGFFTIKIDKSNLCWLRFSFVGYNSFYQCFVNKKDTTVFIKLAAGTNLEQVTISSLHKEKLEQRTESSKVEIPLQQIKILPSLAGEPDILKAYQLMPGIQAGSEGNNGLFVRGGSPDQNLYLLDDVPLYNVSHLGGLFSVFDPSMVKSVEVYKGGFPARYGGRISSVIDVRNKDGNLYNQHSEVGLGIFLSKIFTEGPVFKNKSSYALSVRRCNLDLYTYLYSKLIGNPEINGYTFYDINLKSNFILSGKDRLFISIYSGSDKFYVKLKDKMSLPTEFEYSSKHITKWGNKTASLRWYHVFGGKIFHNLTLAYTQYEFKNYDLSEKITKTADNISFLDEYKFLSKVQDLIFKTDMEVPVDKNTFRAGGIYTRHYFNPGFVSHTQKTKINQFDTILNSPEPNIGLYADELSAYIEFNWHIKEKLSGNIGVHTNNYLIDSKLFPSFEPRILLNFLLLKNISVKAFYCFMKQNLHLLTNSNTGLPSDLWLPSTSKIKPEQSEQYGISIAHTTKSNYELSIEAYIKSLKNLIEYKEGILVFESSLNWDEKAETGGIGSVKGVECLLQKKSGRTNGWIGYTFSKNFRQFDNLNNGLSFPYIYDQRHQFSLVVNYELSDKLSLSGTWLYHSGHSITLPTGKYQMINMNYTDSYYGDRTVMSEVHIYSEKNGYRMPDYHRLDLGLNFTVPKKKGVSKWTIGIINVYNRQNAYFLYFKTTDGKTSLYQQSLFPILVNFGYTFIFQK